MIEQIHELLASETHHNLLLLVQSSEILCSHQFDGTIFCFAAEILGGHFEATQRDKPLHFRYKSLHEMWTILPIPDRPYIAEP